jgi:hypothetical protein
VAGTDRAAVPSADGGARRERAWRIAVTAGAAAVLAFCYLRIASRFASLPILRVLLGAKGRCKRLQRARCH